MSRIYIYDDVEDRFELHPDEDTGDAEMADFLTALMDDYEKGVLHDLRHKAQTIAEEILHPE